MAPLQSAVRVHCSSQRISLPQTDATIVVLSVKLFQRVTRPVSVCRTGFRDVVARGLRQAELDGHLQGSAGVRPVSHADHTRRGRCRCGHVSRGRHVFIQVARVHFRWVSPLQPRVSTRWTYGHNGPPIGNLHFRHVSAVQSRVSTEQRRDSRRSAAFTLRRSHQTQGIHLSVL